MNERSLRIGMYYANQLYGHGKSRLSLVIEGEGEFLVSHSTHSLMDGLVFGFEGVPKGEEDYLKSLVFGTVNRTAASGLQSILDVYFMMKQREDACGNGGREESSISVCLSEKSLFRILDQMCILATRAKFSKSAMDAIRSAMAEFKRGVHSCKEGREYNYNPLHGENLMNTYAADRPI